MKSMTKWWTDTQGLLALRTHSDESVNQGFNYDLSELVEILSPESPHVVLLAVPIGNDRFWVLFAVRLVGDDGLTQEDPLAFTVVVPAEALLIFTELSS